MVRFIHAADLHLDSAFGALSERLAASRRRESRETLLRLAEHVAEHEIDMVLLAGDLFDSSRAFRETGEQLAAALGRMKARVFIAPGNHDWYGPGSPWTAVEWPENVHIFREGTMTAVEWPEKRLVVHGAAFTDSQQAESLLAGTVAAKDGNVHIGLLHGEVDAPEARYDPIRREEIAASGLAYLALGHIHKRMEPARAGNTLWAWPGCLEGHGFDELGEKGFYEGTVDDEGAVSLRFVPFAWRQYMLLEVDVTGRDPREAVEAALPEDPSRDLYRVILTGETGEGGAGAAAIQEALAERCYALEVRDRTRVAEDVWKRAEEDSLRGMFLRQLRSRWQRAETEEERDMVAQAVRFGLAALDHRDLG